MQTAVKERIEDRIGEAARDAKRIRAMVADSVEDGVDTARRVVTHGLHAAEELVDEAEHTVKRHIGTALGITFSLGIGTGLLLGWIGSRLTKK